MTPTAESEGIQTLPSVEVLRLEPGDTIVVTLPEYTAVDLFRQMRDHMQRQFPFHQVIVLAGVSLQMVRPSPTDGSETHG